MRRATVLLFLVAASVLHAAETITRPASVHTPRIRTAQKWNPLWAFRNADDPAPPAWYRPGEKNRAMLWRMRNPFHNFTHYIIGVSDKDITRTGKHPGAVFAPGGGWNWAVTRHRWFPLPFVSFDGKRGRFYLGWRESGNFGGKVNLTKRSSATVPANPRCGIDAGVRGSARRLWTVNVQLLTSNDEAACRREFVCRHRPCG